MITLYMIAAVCGWGSALGCALAWKSKAKEVVEIDEADTELRRKLRVAEAALKGAQEELARQPSESCVILNDDDAKGIGDRLRAIASMVDARDSEWDKTMVEQEKLRKRAAIVDAIGLAMMEGGK